LSDTVTFHPGTIGNMCNNKFLVCV